MEDPLLTLGGRAVDDFADRWAVAQVKPFPPGAEKSLARDLAAQGFQYFVPMERVRNASTRKTHNRILFSGYLFFGVAARYDVVRSGKTIRVIDVLSCAAQAQLRDQLSYIYARLITGHLFTLPPVELGCKAGITGGWFMGYEGIVANRVYGRDAYEVIIEYFGRKMPIEVLSDELERIEPRLS